MEQQKLPNSTLILVLGILSIIGCCLAGIVGLFAGIAAILLAVRAKRMYMASPESYRGYENVKIGRILAIIGIVLSALFLIYIIIVFSSIGLDALSDPEKMQEIYQDKYGVYHTLYSI